ncbi:metallophosphoesterase, partial [archaeon]|nr:metallophosphoesterase [archaeon]
MKKLKILATSDLQGNSVASKQLAAKAEKEHADVVVIAGDILDFGQYAKNMIKPFVEKNERVLIVPGNHDTEDAIESFEKNYKVKNLHGGYARIGDIGFFGCGGTNMPFFNYALSEEEIYKNLKKSFEKVKDAPKKVMVTHMHPSGGFVEKYTFPG